MIIIRIVIAVITIVITVIIIIKINGTFSAENLFR